MMTLIVVPFCTGARAMKDDFVTLASYPYAYQADLARDALGWQDIPSYLGDVHVVTWSWYLTIAVGGIKLYVCEAHMDEALRVLFQHPGLLGREVRHEETSNVSACLQCASVMEADVESCPSCGWTYLPTDGPADDENPTSIRLPLFIRRLFGLFNPKPDDPEPPHS